MKREQKKVQLAIPTYERRKYFIASDVARKYVDYIEQNPASVIKVSEEKKSDHR